MWTASKTSNLPHPSNVLTFHSKAFVLCDFWTVSHTYVSRALSRYKITLHWNVNIFIIDCQFMWNNGSVLCFLQTNSYLPEICICFTRKCLSIADSTTSKARCMDLQLSNRSKWYKSFNTWKKISFVRLLLHIHILYDKFELKNYTFVSIIGLSW